MKKIKIVSVCIAMVTLFAALHSCKTKEQKIAELSEKAEKALEDGDVESYKMYFNEATQLLNDIAESEAQSSLEKSAKDVAKSAQETGKTLKSLGL